MDYKYSPIKGIKQFSSGAINIMSIVSVNNSLDIFFQTDMQTIREKSLQLGDIFIDLLEERCPSLVLVSPRNHENRGSHVSFKHENGLNITKLLRQELRIICDYRFPDIIRFAMTPLYLRYDFNANFFILINCLFFNLGLLIFGILLKAFVIVLEMHHKKEMQTMLMK